MTFRPSGLGKTIFEERYARTPDETWEDACSRVASHVAAAEPDDRVGRWHDDFYEVLVEGLFMPGGRIWYGAGRAKSQLLNCFVVPASDSREGWGKVLSDTIIVSGTGGGVGINLSPIRPRGSEIKGTGGRATGSVSLMQMIDRVGDVLRGGGGRRLALMLALNIDHPDIEEFINVKLKEEELTNANVSVVLPTGYDASQFASDVQSGHPIPLRFGGVDREDRGVGADVLWQTIVDNAWTSGEPGVLNAALANEHNNIWYHKPLISTNPCGEIWLEEYGCCDLGALVLPRFVSAGGSTDYDLVDRVVRLGVRFLDNVLTVNDYPLPEIETNCLNVRRIGLGVMGLHTYLLAKGMKYSSAEALNEVDDLLSFIKNTAYDESTTLAAEKGAFPVYSDALLESGFAQKLKRGIRNKIRTHGLRNCAILTIAPTGTTGMVHGVTTGIEPVMAARYKRRYYSDIAATGRADEIVTDWHYSAYPDIIEDAYTLEPRHHFDMQVTVQEHIDNAVSKTINLPEDYPKEELSDLWLEYLPSIKGSTFYRWGSRADQPIEPLPAEVTGDAEGREEVRNRKDRHGTTEEGGGWEDDGGNGKYVEKRGVGGMGDSSGGYDTLLPFDPSCPDGSCDI
jgi:ribonucleoside-diphosphate reductase alpha chain